MSIVSVVSILLCMAAIVMSDEAPGGSNSIQVSDVPDAVKEAGEKLVKELKFLCADSTTLESAKIQVVSGNNYELRYTSGCPGEESRHCEAKVFEGLDKSIGETSAQCES